MYINKGKNGWYIKVTSKDPGGNEVTGFMNVSFKRDTEPRDNEVSEYGSYQGDLFFRDKYGRERPVFFSSYLDRSNKAVIKMVVMGIQHEVRAEPKEAVEQKKKEESKLVIDPDELPFF